LAGLLAAAFATTARAQSGIVSNTPTVALSASKVASLTVTINSGATQSLASITDNAVNNFASPVNITTAWDINPSASAVVLVGYFNTPASALQNGTFNIASSLVKARLGTSGVFNPFTGGVVTGGSTNIGVAGGTLQLFSQAITGANRNSNRTDDLYLQLDLTGQTTVPGTYTGTLNLRAITQ
ncbi:MAG: hypothetical protein JNJ98_02990, partial [Gemmatimonadetes bacterium]|nr:hypothetical protein [Gemmatimonadota bacterium]